MELKLGKTHKYIIYKISDNLETIEVVKRAAGDASYDDFVAELPADDCRWAVYDFDYKTADGGDRNKIVFYSWYVQSFSSFCSAWLACDATVINPGRGVGMDSAMMHIFGDAGWITTITIITSSVELQRPTKR